MCPKSEGVCSENCKYFVGIIASFLGGKWQKMRRPKKSGLVGSS